MKEGYKKTELGLIPNEWDVKLLNDICEVNPKKEILNENDRVSFISMEQVSNSGGVINTSDRIYKEVSKGYTGFRNKDVLLAKITPCFENGKRALVDNLINGVGFGSTEFHVLRSKEKISSSNFLYYYINTHRFRSLAELNMTGSAGQKRVPTTFLNEIKLVVPTLKEQEKIADILSTVDSQIDDTDKLIEKTKELKKGLMQRLLTKGIGHTEFKKTEVGEIPVEWEVGNNFINIFSGFGFKLNEYVDNGIPLVRINNVTHGKILDEDWCYLPNSYKDLYKEYMLKKGDILLALNRPITRGELKICVVNMKSSILYQRVGKLVMDEERYYPKFFYYYMQSNLFMKKLEAGLVGTDQPYIKNSEFKEMKFVIPSLNEQKQIVDILSSVDTQIEEYENKKMKLEELKRGLMQKLLTGKIRVN